MSFLYHVKNNDFVMTEKLYEEGIVKEVKDGIAQIILNESGSCSSCAAKAVCKSGEDEQKILPARDTLGVHPGDKVRIAINGRNILTAAFLLYGLPLVLFLAGIFFGIKYFVHQKELWGTVLGFVLIAVYAVILNIFSNKKKNKDKLIPEIIFISANLK